MCKTLKRNSIMLMPISQNLLDLVWDDQPSPPENPLLVLTEKYTGISCNSLFVCECLMLFLINFTAIYDSGY